MKRIIIALSIMVLLVALWTGAWLFVANQIDQQVELAARPANPEMMALTCEKFSVTGFPFRFDATCVNATLAQDDVRITAAQIKMTALVYRPTHLLAFAQSPIHISDAFYGTEQEMRFSLAQASLRLKSWRLGRFSIRAEDFSFYDTLLGDALLAASPELEFHLLDIPGEHDKEKGLASLALFARAKSAELTMFAINDGQLTAEAKITALPDDLRTIDPSTALRNWQAAGGELILQKLDGTDTITTIEMTGQASLDETGAISGKVEGITNQLAERFSDLVPPENRILFFGAAQADGSYKQTITIVKGTIFVGIAPQGSLPPLF